MHEVWATLDEEFGQMMENVSGLVRGLLAFKYSKEAKNESSKFMELWRKWNEVCADLHELGKTSVLNHEPTIAAVGNMLPSYSSKDLYNELRLRRLEQGDDELQIMTEFMQAEKKRQKAKERMGTSDNSGAKQEPSQQAECQNCGRRGHRPAECRKPKNTNKSHGTQRKNEKKSHSAASQQPGSHCPACNLQHQVPAK